MSSSTRLIVHSRRLRPRCPPAGAAAAARPSLRVALLALVAVGIRVCSGQGGLTPELVAQLRQACDNCDARFLSTTVTYQNTFYSICGVDQSPLDCGNAHCSRFAEVAKCYQTCLQGYPIFYTPQYRDAFDSFYAQFCDPDCRLSFLPGCFNNLGLPYDLYRSGCDENTQQLNSGIAQCIDLWTNKQNCTGVCKKGQRALSGLRLNLESICRIPSSEFDCATALRLCLDQSYGAYGGSFTAGEFLLNGYGNTSCSAYRGAYSECVTKAVSGDLSFGTPPFTYRLSQACFSYPDVVSYLISLSEAATKPVCDHPELTLEQLCSPGPVATAVPTIAVTTQKATEPTSSTTTPPKRLCKKRKP